MGGGRPRLWLQGARRHEWQFADDYAVFAKRIRRLARASARTTTETRRRRPERSTR